jgi:SAM-dependent methyltransferase
MPIQSKDELESWYHRSDPWDYSNHPDDVRRKEEMLAVLPAMEFRRTLDIGCGNGFLTLDLPGAEVIGTDLSERAIEWAARSLADRKDSGRFQFLPYSMFDPDLVQLGTFDLLIITGVLYPQYIGSAGATTRSVINRLTHPGSVIATCHISEWMTFDLPHTIVDRVSYPYRDRVHDLVIYKR